MLTIGNPAMRRARAQFSSNFFACAGYQVKDNNGFDTAADGVKAALEAKADIIVICSSDDEYATVAPEIFALTGQQAVEIAPGLECHRTLVLVAQEFTEPVARLL